MGGTSDLGLVRVCAYPVHELVGVSLLHGADGHEPRVRDRLDIHTTQQTKKGAIVSHAYTSTSRRIPQTGFTAPSIPPQGKTEYPFSRRHLYYCNYEYFIPCM